MATFHEADAFVLPGPTTCYSGARVVSDGDVESHFRLVDRPGTAAPTTTTRAAVVARLATERRALEVSFDRRGGGGGVGGVGGGGRAACRVAARKLPRVGGDGASGTATEGTAAADGGRSRRRRGRRHRTCLSHSFLPAHPAVGRHYAFEALALCATSSSSTDEAVVAASSSPSNGPPPPPRGGDDDGNDGIGGGALLPSGSDPQQQQRRDGGADKMDDAGAAAPGTGGAATTVGKDVAASDLPVGPSSSAGVKDGEGAEAAVAFLAVMRAGGGAARTVSEGRGDDDPATVSGEEGATERPEPDDDETGSPNASKPDDEPPPPATEADRRPRQRQRQKQCSVCTVPLSYRPLAVHVASLALPDGSEISGIFVGSADDASLRLYVERRPVAAEGSGSDVGIGGFVEASLPFAGGVVEGNVTRAEGFADEGTSDGNSDDEGDGGYDDANLSSSPLSFSRSGHGAGDVARSALGTARGNRDGRGGG